MLNIPLALQNLRIQQLLQPQMDPAPDDSLAVTGPYGVTNDSQSPQESNGYNPRTDLSSAYSNALQAMPQREAPGKMRSIFGAMAGLGAGVHPAGISGGQPVGFEGNPDLAMQTTDRATNAPYYRKLGDWNTNVTALGKGAAEEDRFNTNERIRANNVETQNINRQKAGILQQRADALDEQTRIKEETETNKHEYSMQKLTDNVAIADKKLALAKQKLDADVNNKDAQIEMHKAEYASLQARREAQTVMDKFKYEQLKRMTDAKIKRSELLNSLPNGGTGRGMQERETITEMLDKDGNVTSDSSKAVSKRTVSGPSKQHILSDPDGNKYDTTTWSAGDIAAAKARGWK